MKRSRSRGLRLLVATALVLWALLCLMIAAGAWSLVHQCDEPWPPGSGLCGQLLQAVAAATAGIALLLGAVLVLRTRRAEWVVLAGTLPLLVVHVYFWVVDPDESAFFPLMAAPPPALAAIAVARRRGTRAR